MGPLSPRFPLPMNSDRVSSSTASPTLVDVPCASMRSTLAGSTAASA